MSDVTFGWQDGFADWADVGPVSIGAYGKSAMIFVRAMDPYEQDSCDAALTVDELLRLADACKVMAGRLIARPMLERDLWIRAHLGCTAAEAYARLDAGGFDGSAYGVELRRFRASS